MSAKRVIFIAGTSYSGSTLLDLILANEERAHSVGEIESIFHPVKSHHLELINSLKNDEKWKRILDNGSGNLYKTIFDILDVDIIIDSSKNPIWIREQIDNLPSDVHFDVVLVYKRLEEFAESFLKRGRSNWIEVYKNYHSLFFAHHSSFWRIAYHDIPLKTNNIMRLLEDLGLSNDEARFNFWKKKQTNFFGNNHANVAFDMDKGGGSPELRYNSKISPIIMDEVKMIIKKDQRMREIVEFLGGESASIDRPARSNLKNSFLVRSAIKKLRVLRFRFNC